MQQHYTHHHAQAVALLAVQAHTPLRTFDAAPLTPEAIGVAAIVHLQVSHLRAAARRSEAMAAAHGAAATCTTAITVLR